jgi:hypothetical protein
VLVEQNCFAAPLSDRFVMERAPSSNSFKAELKANMGMLQEYLGV